MKKGGFIFIGGTVVYIAISLNPMSEGLSKSLKADEASLLGHYQEGREDLLIINTIETHGWLQNKIKEVVVKPPEELKVVKEKVPPDKKAFFVSHRVQAGDTLWRISAKYKVQVSTIVAVNKLKQSSLRLGQRLRIPTQYGLVYVEQTMPQISVQDNPLGVDLPPLSRVEKAKNLTTDRLVDDRELFSPGNTDKEPVTFDSQVKSSGFLRPVPGRITSEYGYREGRLHEGIDMAACTGQPVCASASGEVNCSGWIVGYGWVVILEHKDGYTTRYAHNSALLVKSGDKIQSGQIIARAGSSGAVDGSHLHFEIRKDGVPQNPLHYLN